MWNWRTLIRMVSYVENSKQNVCATWRSISFVHIRAFYFSCTYVRFWICTHYFLSKKEGQKHSNYFFCHYKTSYLRLYHCKKRPEEITSYHGKTHNRYKSTDTGWFRHFILLEVGLSFLKLNPNDMLNITKRNSTQPVNVVEKSKDILLLEFLTLFEKFA